MKAGKAIITLVIYVNDEALNDFSSQETRIPSKTLIINKCLSYRSVWRREEEEEKRRTWNSVGEDYKQLANLSQKSMDILGHYFYNFPFKFGKSIKSRNKKLNYLLKTLKYHSWIYCIKLHLALFSPWQYQIKSYSLSFSKKINK